MAFSVLSFYGIKIIKLLLARVTTLAESQLPFKGLTHTSGVGTCLYASPEQLQGSHYDFKVENFVLFLVFSINMLDNRNKSSLSIGKYINIPPTVTPRVFLETWISTLLSHLLLKQNFFLLC